jgi:two-component system NtrC family sensor kinase
MTETLNDAVDPQQMILELQRKLDERTAERNESIAQQAATAEILKIIAGAPSDVQPVFEAIAASANRLIGGFSTAVYRVIDDIVHLVAFTPTSPEADEALKAVFPLHRKEVPSLALVQNGETAQIADAETADAQTRRLGRVRGWRSVTFTPLISQGALIGFIACTRRETGVLADHHVQLLRTFADQAVIAIENARLFNETKEALEHQTATSEVLQVISGSMADAQPVFERILDSIERLFEFKTIAVLLAPEDGLLHLVARRGIDVTQFDTVYPMPLEETGAHRAISERRQVYFPDVINGENVPNSLHRGGEAFGNFSNLITPMFWEAKFIGEISVLREPNAVFTPKELSLLKTFADQAVVAIQNAQLFNEVQARTKELVASLDELRTAQDRLVQTEKLASLGQLTAGIAHEIKNPLNFVNNFSALSAELTDELNDVLKPVALERKVREEVEELTGLLKDNLEKVVQHGKRADSIVKNMLLHSRAGSGEHRPVDVNALLDESLNLAYHGARAEKAGFEITLQRDFDPDAGAIEMFPQEITRAFLNLISNGFYAVTKRKSEADDETFEPVLSATTRSLGNRVEIRIRDNGTGIPPEVREKIFNPFFTTKPAGEGTGLGLSMSHDIIVKQHGGSINVETERGVFTEFIITLPRGDTASDSKPE